MSEPMPALPGGPDPAGDSDKLPWLEPYRERTAKPESPPPPPAPVRIARPQRRGGSTALLGVVAALALGAGGYWFGRQTAPHEVINPQTTVIAPLPQSAAPVQHPGDALPYRSLDEQPPLVAANPGEAPRLSPTRAHRDRHAAHRNRPAVRPQRQAPPPPPAAPPPPKPRAIAPPTTPTPAPLALVPLPPPTVVVVHRYSPPPPLSVGGPGEVIELGAFISRRTANAAFRRVARRYPYLGARPRVVSPFPRSAGWPPVYRLRLGTGSTRNAKILCRYIHSIGQRCSVV